MRIMDGRRVVGALSRIAGGCALAALAADARPAAADLAKADGAAGSQIRFAVEKYKLANGLTVLLHEDHSAPLISYQTWFRVGSKNEEAGLTGMAHLFEHMMFKGAKRYGGDQFDQLLQANGGVNNAGTTHDYTYYFENLPAGKLELAVDLESDRMQSLRVSDENLASEREVVKEERRFRIDNNPMGALREAVFGTAFRVSAYRWPVAGYMADIQAITAPKAQEFHKTYYAPNNAIVIVAGDFQSADAKALIEKYYGSIPSQPIPDRPRPTDPPQTAARMQNLVKEVQNATFSFAFRTPKDGTDEAFALDLVAAVLGKGSSSRLHKRLVYKEQLASQVAAYNETMQEAGLLQIVCSMKPGANLPKAERAVQGELWRMRNHLVTPDELQAAKNHSLKSLVDGLKTVHGKGEALGLSEVFHGDYEELFRAWDRYARVTPETMRAAAKKYLEPQQTTFVVLRPALKRAAARQGASR